MIDRIHNIKILLESISCLCAEGPEFMDKLQLIEAINRDNLLAIKICDDLIRKEEG